MARVHNFNAGPAVLPVEVLEQARDQMLDYEGSGASIMECSHRGKEYSAVHEEAVANLRRLLGLSDDYAVLLLQGGASTQFAMVPMNLARPGGTVDYVNSGEWASKAIEQARLDPARTVHVCADTAKANPTRIPAIEELKFTPGADYVHITSNETIAGTQWKQFPVTESPLVADMSSDILSRPFDPRQFGLIYAGAQKNLGPSGVTLVAIRRDLAERVASTVPTMLRYKTHIEHDSLYNTPPCFAVYVLMLVTRWVDKVGLACIHRKNERRASRLYAAIDRSGFYRGAAAPECRSVMNVTFRLKNAELESAFIKEAEKRGMVGLKGHRSVGGLRASLYNALPDEAVDALVDFMADFEARHG